VQLESLLAEDEIFDFRNSGLFDEDWYTKEYPDVGLTGLDPAAHYIWIGARLNRRPSADAVPGALPDAAAEHLASALEFEGINPLANFANDGSWPPYPVNGFWPAQSMRDFFIEGYEEQNFLSYWYLMSVMSAWCDDPEGFANGSGELDVVVGRLRELAAARSEHQARVSNVYEPDASIIIPVHNNLLDTLLCLVSVLENAGNRSFDILVADDASSDGTDRIVSQIGGNVAYFRQPENLGFLRNCNTSVERCSGRYIVLLNNDTLVMPGWLDALLAPFENDPAVGLTGSKLINWDGTLQEAGGIFWEDGSAWNFGRGGRARDPQYNYVKDVDYCSGASIALPRRLWDELEGFDEHYLPAYCEDSDLAFRVRAKGYRSVYTPFSEVVHHEGRSHGRDTSSGIKAYQVTNQAKLFERWGDVLRQDHNPNAVDVLRARDRSRQKKHVLVIDHYIPQWDQDAGSRTIYQFIQSMLALDWQVTFWPDNLYYDAAYGRPLQEMGVEVIWGDDLGSEFEGFCRERSNLYDVVLLSRPHIAVKYIDTVRAYMPARVYYYGHDIHFNRMQNMRDLGLSDAPTGAEIDAMRTQELKVCNQSDLVLYPSVEEAEAMARLLVPSVDCRAIPAYCFVPSELDQAANQIGSRVRRSGAHELLFVGGFAHSPNVDGIVWFVEEVLPFLRGRLDFRLRIVGSKPIQKVHDLAAADVEVLGFVSDQNLFELYSETDVVVAPLRYGAGVKGKVVEAAARGLPIVTTDIGAQGLNSIQPHLFIGNSPDEFAEALMRASNREQAAQAAQAALDAVLQEFSQASIGAIFSAGLALESSERE
jgi:GT2 family glycosyltransferase